MKTRLFQGAILILVLLVSGCSAKRSISDSGYREDVYHYGNNMQYQGELNELSVLGMNGSDEISEEAIKSAFSDSKPISLKRGDSVMLIQSGARFPDEVMTRQYEQIFSDRPYEWDT